MEIDVKGDLLHLVSTKKKYTFVWAYGGKVPTSGTVTFKSGGKSHTAKVTGAQGIKVTIENPDPE